MFTINTIPICPFRDFIFSLRNYPHLIDKYLLIIWVAYFGCELKAQRINKEWEFSADEKTMYETIKTAYKEKLNADFDFVKNGTEKLDKEMSKDKKLHQSPN
jgi:hypothetical protein